MVLPSALLHYSEIKKNVALSTAALVFFFSDDYEQAFAYPAANIYFFSFMESMRKYPGSLRKYSKPRFLYAKILY